MENEVKTLAQLSYEVHQVARSKNFWDGNTNLDKIGNKIALIHSEATEILEALRKNKGPAEISEEFADLIIRTLDLYQALTDMEIVKYSLDFAIEQKHYKNKQRPPLHGNLF
jgi:NTP pyrophosphatase (non-canonical NTP hydrolase)